MYVPFSTCSIATRHGRRRLRPTAVYLGPVNSARDPNRMCITLVLYSVHSVCRAYPERETVRGHSETGVSRKRNSAAAFDRVTKFTVNYRCRSREYSTVSTGCDSKIGFITVGRLPRNPRLQSKTETGSDDLSSFDCLQLPVSSPPADSRL